MNRRGGVRRFGAVRHCCSLQRMFFISRSCLSPACRPPSIPRCVWGGGRTGVHIWVDITGHAHTPDMHGRHAHCHVFYPAVPSCLYTPPFAVPFPARPALPHVGQGAQPAGVRSAGGAAAQYRRRRRGAGGGRRLRGGRVVWQQVRCRCGGEGWLCKVLLQVRDRGVECWYGNSCGEV